MNMRGRIVRLEKWVGVTDGQEMSDSDLLSGLRMMFQADPDRRWEAELPAHGYALERMLAEARANRPASATP